MSLIGIKRARSSASYDDEGPATGHTLFFQDDGSPHLFALYSGDLSERMFSYATASDLCNLDSVNRQFNELTTEAAAAQWKILTYERFGMRNGKDDWKLGVSFLREPIFFKLDTAMNNPHGANLIAAHNSLIATATDDNGMFDNRRHEPKNINLFDARNLEHIRTREGWGWCLAMAGSTGHELLITSTYSRLVFTNNEEEEGCPETQMFPNHGASIEVIGNATHVIFVAGNMLYLNKVLDREGDIDVRLYHCIVLGEVQVDEFDRDQLHSSIAWGVDESTEFVVSFSSLDSQMMSIWYLDPESDQITQTQAISIDTEAELNEVALGEDYIIGASLDRKIHVWDRKTGTKLPYILCDAIEEDQVEADEAHLFPIRLSCHGHLLITTSHIGRSLCVWDMKNGQLLQKYESPEDPQNNVYSTGMIYWKHLNGFICACGYNKYLNIWTFPTSQEQHVSAMTICNRELVRRQNQVDAAPNNDEVVDQMDVGSSSSHEESDFIEEDESDIDIM